jgi:RIO kinase 1
MEKLEQLLADGVIEAILGRLKSGKEADIWIVQHAGEPVAAKIYRDRDVRSFRNNADYKEGRTTGNSRTERAVARGSKFGRDAAEQAWKSAEADALERLRAAAVRAPVPVMFYEGVLLMQLVVDDQGYPAPRLIDAQITAETAGAYYRDLRAQIIRMLDADLIHGDLSPYNILLGAQGPTIIDFPQVIAAAKNSRAEAFFHRDLENVRRHLAGFDRSLNACAGDAREIWRAYVRRELSPDWVPTGRPPPEPKQHAPKPQAHPQQPKQQQHPGQQQRGNQPIRHHPQSERSAGGPGNSQRHERQNQRPPAPARQAPRQGQRTGPVVERVMRLPGAPSTTPAAPQSAGQQRPSGPRHPPRHRGRGPR